MAITRRQFLKYAAASAAALGLSELELFQLTEKIMATPPGGVPNASRPKIIGLQGQACNGDAVSLVNLLNSIPPDTVRALKGGAPWQHTIASGYTSAAEEFLGVNATWGASPTTTIDDVLIDLIDLKYHPTLAGPGGALGYKEGVINAAATADLVLVEGSVPVGATQTASMVGAGACKVGDQKGDGTGAAETMVQALTAAANGSCAAIVAVGTCACYGGIPAAKNGNATYVYGSKKGQVKYRSTGALSVADALTSMGITGKPVVHVPGCPIRGDDLFLVVAQAILYGVPSFLASGFLTVEGTVPTRGKPKSILGINLFGQTQHYHCSRKQAYANGDFATSFADTTGKCLAMLGCKGPTTYASCQRNKKHQWNPVAADGATDPIHDTSPASLWPGIATVPVFGGNLGTVSNNGGSSCIKKGHPCIGCKEKGFPDRFSPLVNYNN